MRPSYKIEVKHARWFTPVKIAGLKKRLALHLPPSDNWFATKADAKLFRAGLPATLKTKTRVVRVDS